MATDDQHHPDTRSSQPNRNANSRSKTPQSTTTETSDNTGDTGKLHAVADDFLSRASAELLAELEREREKTYRWIEKHGLIAHRIKAGDKAPLGDWRTRKKSVELKHFRRGEGIGVKLGQKYGGLIDIDLDDSMAVAVAANILPATAALFGRKNNPRSHYLYFLDSDEELQRETLIDPYLAGNESMILELRGDGGFQTRVPGSFAVDDETGGIELVRWDKDIDIPPVPKREKPETLRLVTRKIGATVLLTKYVWQEGIRNDAGMCAAGWFGRTYNWTEDDTKHLLTTVMKFAGDDQKDLVSRIKTIEATFRKLESGEKRVKGGPKLTALLSGDPRIVNRLNEWFRRRPFFPDLSDKGVLRSTVPNGKIALQELEIECSYDLFKNVEFIKGDTLPDHSDRFDDKVLVKHATLIHDEFHFHLHPDPMYQSICGLAQENRFHPVRDYLNSLHWDNKDRLNRWLIDYSGAEDTEYVRAVSAIVLIAAVRRVRPHGCKFDQMLILENPQQGTNKSTALATLAIKPEWFSDNLDLSQLSGREAIDQVEGYRIIEAPELKGLARPDVNRLKTFLSRTSDRWRKAYGRGISEVPRQGIIVGTTNQKTDYLMDRTGNRRFWPVRIGNFDLRALIGDREQLWAEAATREKAGESIRLPESLWAVAAEEQAKRTGTNSITDILVAELMNPLEGRKDSGYKISRVDIWKIINTPVAQRANQEIRLTEAVMELGFRKPNETGTIRFSGKISSCLVIGKEPYAPIIVERDNESPFFQIRINDDTIFSKSKEGIFKKC